MDSSNKSEVAAIREQIQLEYEASQRVFNDFTATGRHEFITKRQENIGVYFERLSELMPKEEAIAIVAEALDSLQSACSLSGSIS